jgi:hypothetical protein
VQPCSDSSDFREQQCAAYNDVPYEGQLFKWGVHHDEMEPCSLSCKTRSKDGRSTLVVQLAPKVQDGTRCRHGSLDMCISGKCQVSALYLEENVSFALGVCMERERCNKAARFASGLRLSQTKSYSGAESFLNVYMHGIFAISVADTERSDRKECAGGEWQSKKVKSKTVFVLRNHGHEKIDVEIVSSAMLLEVV